MSDDSSSNTQCGRLLGSCSKATANSFPFLPLRTEAEQSATHLPPFTEGVTVQPSSSHCSVCVEICPRASRKAFALVLRKDSPSQLGPVFSRWLHITYM